MKSTIKYCLIFIFLCKSFTTRCDTIVSGFNYADSLFNSGKFESAALEYERIYFVSSESQVKSLALLKKSYCLKKTGNFESALNALNRSENEKPSDSLMYIINQEHALISFLNNDYTRAELILNQLDQESSDSLKQYDYMYLKIIVLNELLKWDESSLLLKKYFGHRNIILDSQTENSLFSQPRLLSSKTAKILSYLIPGSGQIYSGHVLRGITSLGLQGSALIYAIIALQKSFYLSAIFTGFGLFQMFYLGGVRYSVYLVDKENAKKIFEYNKRIRDFVLSIENIKK